MFPAPNAYTPSPGTQRITIQSTRSNRYAFEIMVVQKQEWTESKPSAPKLIKPCTHSGREPGPQLHDVKSQSPRSEALVGDVRFGLRASVVLSGARTLRGRHWTDKQRQCASKILLYCSSHLHALAPVASSSSSSQLNAVVDIVCDSSCRLCKRIYSSQRRKFSQ